MSPPFISKENHDARSEKQLAFQCPLPAKTDFLSYRCTGGTLFGVLTAKGHQMFSKFKNRWQGSCTAVNESKRYVVNDQLVNG